MFVFLARGVIGIVIPGKNAMINLYLKVTHHAQCRPGWEIGLIGSLTRLMISPVLSIMNQVRRGQSDPDILSEPPLVFVSLIC